MRKELLDEPVLTRTPAFSELALEALNEGFELAILNRYANCGGYREYFLVKNQEEFLSIINNAPPKTSISVFFAGSLPIRGIADAEAQALEFLKSQQEQDREIGLSGFCDYSQLSAIQLVYGIYGGQQPRTPI